MSLRALYEAEIRAMRNTLDMLENMDAQIKAMDALFKAQLDELKNLRKRIEGKA